MSSPSKFRNKRNTSSPTNHTKDTHMKPRWHQVKIDIFGMQRTGWMKPVSPKTDQIALFDDKVKYFIALSGLQARIKEKTIVVGECLTLKAHLLIEERFKACPTVIGINRVRQNLPNMQQLMPGSPEAQRVKKAFTDPTGFKAFDSRGGQPAGEISAIMASKGTGKTLLHPYQEAASNYMKEKFKTVEKFDQFEVSIVDMSNGKNPGASPIDKSKEVKE